MSKSKVQNAQSGSPKTKKAKVLALLMRRSGATVSQIGKATGWQAHSIRAALTRMRQQGVEIEREKVKGASRYRVAERKVA